MNGSRDDLIAYRLARADESLKDARILLDAGSLPGAVNRLYYACFYAVSALLLTRNISSSKYSGILAAFNQQLVKPGVVDPDDGRLYNDLYTNRTRGDYQDHATFERADVAEWCDQAARFLANFRALIATA